MAQPAKPVHLHYAVDTAIGEMIEVSLDHAANVLVMTTHQYENYKVRDSASAIGGTLGRQGHTCDTI